MTSQRIILSRGVIQFFNPSLTNSQIIHNLTKTIHLDGFQVETISIFENPMAAVVQLLPTQTQESFFKRRSALPPTIRIMLDISDLDSPHNLNKLSYKIECFANPKNKEWSILSLIADTLSQQLIANLKLVENQKTQRQYPHLVLLT